MKHLDIKIFGLVQGVFFRANAKKKAEELQITGFIRNEPDGAVYIEAEGKKENLQHFLDWCKNGPPMALVEKVESEYSSELKNFSNFLTV